MANNHGGRRSGSGRKKADIKDRVLSGTMVTDEIPTLNVSSNLSSVDKACECNRACGCG